VHSTIVWKTVQPEHDIVYHPFVGTFWMAMSLKLPLLSL